MDKIEMEEVQQKLLWLNKFHTLDKITILNAMKERFGNVVYEIVEEVEGQRAMEEWHKISESIKDTSIERLIQLLWEPLREKGFEFETESILGGIQMKCTRCPIYDMAKELNATDWLYHHTCATDPYIAAGFNPEIKMKREHTLMEGHAYCDHFYYLEEH